MEDADLYTVHHHTLRMELLRVCCLLSLCLILLPSEALGYCFGDWIHHQALDVCYQNILGNPPNNTHYCQLLDTTATVMNIEGVAKCKLPTPCLDCGGGPGGLPPPGK